MYSELSIDKLITSSDYEWRELMGILDRCRKKQTVPQEEKSDEKLLLDIAASISYDDSKVIAEMEECILDTGKYFKKHCEHYEARGVKNSDNIDNIRWLTLVDVLVHHGYVCELNWKCGKEGFVYFIKKTLLVQTEKLPVTQEWLNDEGDITEWCHILDNKWQAQGMCVAAIEIEGGSYIIFPYQTVALSFLQDAAGRIGRRIYKC